MFQTPIHFMEIRRAEPFTALWFSRVAMAMRFQKDKRYENRKSEMHLKLQLLSLPQIFSYAAG